MTDADIKRFSSPLGLLKWITEHIVTKTRQQPFEITDPYFIATPNGGIQAFLARFCTQPKILKPVFDRQPRRLTKLNDGDVLCRFGDAASEFWIIVDGQIRVERNSFALWRRPGELVGEAAFYRNGAQTRGATLTASKDTWVFKVDRTFVEGLYDIERPVWHETMACVLTAKLDEATDDRDRLRKERIDVDALVARLVCSEGRDAALAAMIEGTQGEIDPESCDAIVWFSDLAGFSSYCENLPALKAGALIGEIMDVQGQAIRAHGGQIDKHMGDGLMAF